MAGTQLTFENGDVVDAPITICHACQQPGATKRGTDGERYHGDCLPEAGR